MHCVSSLQCKNSLLEADSSAPEPPASKPKDWLKSSQWTHSDVLGRLIVRFKSYKSAADHKAGLSAALSQASGPWKWIERQNAAAVHPTDFALLEVTDTASDSIKVS